MVKTYRLQMAGTLTPIEIPIVELGGAPQMSFMLSFFTMYIF